MTELINAWPWLLAAVASIVTLAVYSFVAGVVAGQLDTTNGAACLGGRCGEERSAYYNTNQTHKGIGFCDVCWARLKARRISLWWPVWAIIRVVGVWSRAFYNIYRFFRFIVLKVAERPVSAIYRLGKDGLK